MRAIALLFLSACTSAGLVSYPPSPEDAPKDAAVEEAALYDGPLCCQVQTDWVDSAYWNNCRWACYPDASVAVNLPWVCNLDNPTTCLDPACAVGSTCQGFNGIGVVLPCGADGGPTNKGLYCPEL